MKISGPTMGTQYHISWVSSQSGQDAMNSEKERLKNQIEVLLTAINRSMSTYDPESELSLLNTQFKSQWQDISVDLFRVLMMAKQVNQRSEGAFDVTIGPLVNLWGFGPNKSEYEVPSEAQITQVRGDIGSEVLDLRLRDEGYQLKTAEKRYIDLSAIAKGYAVDEIGRFLQREGIKNYLVEVGGEIVANGSKPKEQPWRIAIEAPNDDGRSVQIIVPLANMGIATSGDYRNFFEKNGQRYSHTIDGRTGYPVTHNLASVSVLHETVALADAWATALTVLGSDAGLKLAEEYKLAAYFIVRTETGFKQYKTRQFEQLNID